MVSVFPDPAGPEGAPPSFMLSALINVLRARSVRGVITRRLALPRYSKPYSIWNKEFQFAPYSNCG